jgi:hypothetical protein
MVKDFQEQQNLEEVHSDNYDKASLSQEEEDSPASFHASRLSDRNRVEAVETSDDYEGDYSSSEARTEQANEEREGAAQQEELEITKSAPVKEGDGQHPEQSATPSTMSKEEVLLLQVLRRAKRQQELIAEVQRSLRALTSIDKGIEKTAAQVKQLQSTIKDTQKQMTQLRRQVVAVERAQTKGFQKMTISQKAGPSSRKAKVATGKNKRNKSKRRL